MLFFHIFRSEFIYINNRLINDISFPRQNGHLQTKLDTFRIKLNTLLSMLKAFEIKFNIFQIKMSVFQIKLDTHH